jgi:hypothetical protein
MSDTMAQPPEEFETWVNSLQGIIVVKKFGETGRLVDHLVYGGRKIELTPKERRLNSERANSTEQDFFANGSLQPVKLIESEADHATLVDNPNVIGDTQMREMFGVQWKAFEKRIGEIDSPLVVRRLIAIAEEPGTNASVRELETLKARMAELSPEQAEIQHIQDISPR